MGLRRVSVQCRGLVRKMLSRPEQADPGAEASAERMQRRFSDLVDTCSRFARDIVRDAGWSGGSAALFDPVIMNMEIDRTVFGKWSLDILTLLYMRQPAGIQEIRRGLGRSSSRVLSSKLTRMHDTGLIRRDLKPTRPPRCDESLTDLGRRVAKHRHARPL